jgi:antitoxin HigA-1
MNAKVKIQTKTKLLPLIKPGEVLDEEFLKPLGVTEYRLAKAIAVPPRRINEIVHGKRAITTNTAWRLGQYFGTTPQFWLNLQSSYDLRRLERQGGLPKIERLAVAA